MDLNLLPEKRKSVGINLGRLFYSGTKRPDHLFFVTEERLFYYWILIIVFFHGFSFVFGLLAKQ